jgi:penicillin-binding protein 1C
MKPGRKIRVALVAASVALLAWMAVPRPPLREGMSFSRAVFDRGGHLLRLTLAADERYRLWVPLSRISPAAVEATLLYEDRHFRLHPGVNPVALVRAAARTYLGGGRRMGGSTLTMQLARIRYRIDSRTPWGKLLQILRALQLERHYSKEELLEAYLNLAPYGNNVEGVGAASLVYFGKEAEQLGVRESMALAVVPQSPLRRAPGAARPHGPVPGLDEAAARLARRWLANHPGDEQALAPGPLAARAPSDLPFLAPHFVGAALASGSEGIVATTLDLHLQRMLERALRAHVERRRPVGIENAAALLVDRRSMEVLASVGSADFLDARIDGQVDGTRARRSPGSALKPFVYALALEQGLIHPLTVLEDAPARFRGYDPENFDGRFMGPLSATDALNRSRNVPAVKLSSRLHPGLHDLLSRAGVGELQPEAWYGLSIALGGAEVTMEELVQLYAMLASGGVHRPLRTRLAAPPATGRRLLSVEAAWVVLDMLSKNPRPGAEVARFARRNVPVSWKTGTSHGYRDAWAVGVSGPYVLAIWVGRFDGQGNPAFVGIEAAAPLLFQVFDALRAEERAAPFPPDPPPGLVRVAVCPISGKLPGPHCRHTEVTWFLPGTSPIDTCDVHREVLVDRAGRRACGPGPGVRAEVYELWPSDLLRLFAEAGIPRRVPPPATPGCRLDDLSAGGVAPRITSPQEGVAYVLRASQPGEQSIPLTAVTDGDAREVYWFADAELVGKARPGEPLSWHARPGRYAIRAVDDRGRAGAVRVQVSVVE